MAQEIHISIIIILILTSHGFATSINEDPFDLHYDCPKSGFSYSLGSAFHENLNHTLFTQFSINTAAKTSSNFTIGKGIDTLYALYYCRGDVDVNTCHRCIQAAITKISHACKNLKQGIVWYEECTLRYANYSIFSIDEVRPTYSHYNRTSLVSEYHLDPYKNDFDSTMKGLIDQAAYNGSLHGFAVKEINLSSSETLRGLAQCTPFINGTLCEKCLRAALKQMYAWYVTMTLLPSCLVRYDLYGSPAPPPSSDRSESVGLPVRYQVLIALLSAFVILSLLGGFWFWKSRCSQVLKENRTTNAEAETNNAEATMEVYKNIGEGNIQGFTRFTYSEVEDMTSRLQHRLGEGAYGVVYYGRLSNGREVAVKMLSKSDAPKQFSNEIQVLGRISHKNLVSLYGYCDEGAVLALIYEYMSGGDLKILLSSVKHSDVELRWKKRLEIALDTAQGLEYLHNVCSPAIVHRDVKPANILLNQHHQAKVADFGHSRIFPAEFVSRLSATVVGTPGYVDPQYYSTGQVNERSDVYSFGVVMLELITGQKAILSKGTNLVQWVRPLITRGDIGSILDPNLRVDVGENYNSVWRVTELANRCVDLEGRNRPTMTEIIMELRECLVLLENTDNAGSSSSAPTTTEMMTAVMSTISMNPQPR